MHLTVIFLLALSANVLAEVSSETLYFLQPDGERYLLLRAIHSDSRSHRFHLPKEVQIEDLLQVSPARYDWDDEQGEVNTLSFDSGGFSLLYPGKFTDSQVTGNRKGEWRFSSWDGRQDDGGRFGYWYAPGDFDRYTFTWVVPENFEVTRYRSNRKGTWTRHPRSVSFYAEKVNNLTFEIDYRRRPGSVPAQMVEGNPPGPVAAVPEFEAFRPQQSADRPTWGGQADAGDKDGDGVPNGSDLCPRTPRGAQVDRAGCALDTDRDGVPDGVDRCLATPEGQTVDVSGCSDS